MSADYTDRDVRRAAKEVAAACQATFDAHRNMAAALGKLLGIMAEVSGAPDGMTPLMAAVDELVGKQEAAYNAIVDAIQSGI